MPVSTRQTTPGPSVATSTVSNTPTHSVNSKKRPASEIEILENLRNAKKMKAGGETSSTISIHGKDKKKKKRRKKKRSTVVIQNSSNSGHNEVSKATPEVQATTKRGSTSTSREPEQNLMSSSVGNEVKLEESINPEDSLSDKGKGKVKSNSPPRATPCLLEDAAETTASGSGSSNLLEEMSSQATEIALLKEQLASKDKLLNEHQNLFHNHQQSLTCQICHDPLYKPYALAPCGHITCYGCLIRWFTAPQNPEAANAPVIGNVDNVEAILDTATAKNGAFIRRRKMCPVCRAVVSERPIVMWSIKDMVAALVRSGLAEIPPPVHKTSAEDANNVDPWRNLFRKAGLGNALPFGAAFNALFPQAFGPPPVEQGDEDREQMGWHDAEDGGIYRCTACYHEIWDGICSGCQRRYPGHGLDDDDDDDDEGSDGDGGHPLFFGPQLGYHFDDDDADSDGEDDIRDHQNWMVDDPENLEDGSGSDDDASMDLFDYLRIAQRHWHGQHVEQAESEGEGSENDEYGGYRGPYLDESSEGSFIDDDDVVERFGNQENDEDEDDEVEVIEAPAVRRARRRVLDDESDGEESDVIDLDDDEDGVGADVEPVAGILRQYLEGGLRRRDSNVVEVDLDSDGEDEDLVVEEDDEDEDEDEDVLLGDGGPRLTRRGRRIQLMSDEDEDDE